MPMYSLILYSSYYSDKTDSLWSCSKGETTNFDADISNTNVFKSFECNPKLSKNTVADENNSIFKNLTI